MVKLLLELNEEHVAVNDKRVALDNYNSEVEDGGLGQGDAFADVPQVVRLPDVFGNDRVGHDAVFHRGFQQVFELRAGMRLGFTVGRFQQHAPHRFAPHRHAQMRIVRVDQPEPFLAHHLKTRERRRQMPVRQRQQCRGGLQRRHRGPRRQLRGRLRIQPQRGRRA